MNPKQQEFKQQQLNRLNQAISNHTELVLLSIYNVLFINDMVDGLVIDTFSELKKANLYRHQLKQLSNAMMQERHNYERLVNRCLGDRTGYLADANELYCDEVRRHVSTFTYTIKMQLDKRFVPNAMFLATLETARVLCESACLRLDFWMHHLRKADSALVRISSIDYLRLTDLCTRLNRLAEEAYSVKQRIDLNSDAQCKLARKVLLNKISDDEITRKAALTNDSRETA